MKKLLNKTYAPIVALVWNLLLVFLVYQIARLEYYMENANYLSYSFDVFRGGLLFDTSAIVYTNVLYIVMMLFPLHLKENNVYHQLCKWVFIIVNGIAFAVNLADSVYFQYTMRRTTTSVFQEFSNEGNLTSIIGKEFLSHWYLVLLFVLVMVALWICYAKPRLQSRKIFSWWKYDLSCLVSLLLLVPLSIAGMRGGFTTAVRPITLSNANQYVKRPLDAALVLNTPFSLIRSIGKNVFSVPRYYENEEEMARIYSPLHEGESVDSVFTRKNVVILIVESFGREYIGAFNKDLEGGKYKGYTPCVDSLISKSTTFRYSFCNGRKSIDGMPSILSSIPMFVEPFILTPASMNDYTGLAGILGAEGYETAFFHGAENGSMGFQAFAQKTGFQHYYGRTEYEAAKGTADFDGTWAIWDEPFLQKCIRYTDMSIGKFFDTASRQPWFQHTIFVLTSDHTNMSDHAEYQTDLGGFCSPIIIYEPSKPVGEMQDKIAQQIDILPTVLGKLGFSKPYLGFGIDVLNTPKEQTWAVNYLNGIYQYVYGDYVLQFDGTQTKGVYRLDDRLMKNNLKGKVKEQAQLETTLKAIIQQYMERMTQNRLVPSK